jgi:hypothetical protein
MVSRTSSLTVSTQLLLKGESGNLTAQNAWEGGTNIRTALRLHPQQVRAWFLLELGKLIKFVDATKTIQDDEEMKETARALMEEFPAMKLEEWDLIFTGIKREKFGPMYGRLKLGELMQCARKWEEMRAEKILERKHRPEYDPHQRSYNREEPRKAILLTVDDLIDLGQIKPRE